LEDHRIDAAKRDRQFLKDECESQKSILDKKKGVHRGEKADVAQQKTEVAQAAGEVEAAEKAVAEKAHCPSDLASAESELARLELLPNKKQSDIDDECKVQQKKLEAERCVELLKKAQAVLDRRQGAHAQEIDDLNHEHSHVHPAASALPPQEEKVAEACARWKELEAMPVPPAAAGLLAQCQAERDDLRAERVRHAAQGLQDLEDTCAREKRILAGVKEVHNQERVDHALQRQETADAKVKVNDAQKIVAEHAHCPPALEEAKADLARLEAMPNKQEADIDAECKLHERILYAQRCVDDLRKAEEVLSRHESVHASETSELRHDAGEAWTAKQEVAPQEQKVAEVCAVWDAAKAKWEAANRACEAP
jgi:hypothetical protein